jgi:hypothetical protein
MPDTTPSRHFDPNTRDALIHAALVRDTDEIDRITDELARQGVCRPRADMSRMDEWVALRTAPAPLLLHVDPIVTLAGKSDIGAQMAAHFRGVFVGAGQ